jgi:2,3-bisphosphoglycerate-dependent phosphoglycerate mutase
VLAEPTRIAAIRHGETAWNRETRMQGQLDIALNANGRAQARCLAAALADEAFDAIYSSDLLRAHQTAQALAASCLAPIVTDVGLRERCFGIFESLTYADVQVRWPDQARRWHQRDPDFGPAHGEVLRDFYERCLRTLTRLAAAHPGCSIAIVTHGGVLDCLYRAATRIDLQAPRSWELGNASINRLLYTPQGFTLVGWSDNAHLQGADQDAALDDADERLGAAGHGAAVPSAVGAT